MAFEFFDPSFAMHTQGGHVVYLQASDYERVGDYDYHGFVSDTGTWMIQRIKTDRKEIRYVFGQSEYSAAWSDKGNKTYEIYNTAISTLTS